MASTSGSSSNSSDGDASTTVSVSSSTSSVYSPHRLPPRPEPHIAHRKRIEVWIGVWEAVSFPCLYPSEEFAALESGTSFDSRCRAFKPGRPLDYISPWLLSTVVIPSQDERGLLHNLFAELPEVSQTTERRREYAHKVLLTLTQSQYGSLTKLLTVPCLIRKCLSAVLLIQRQNFLDVADYIDLRLTLYRVSVAAIWQRIGQQPPRRVSLVYHHIVQEHRKVVLVLGDRPSAFFTRLVELSFDQILYSAREVVVLEPLFEEDGHGFKIQPKLDDIHWNEQ